MKSILLSRVRTASVAACVGGALRPGFAASLVSERAFIRELSDPCETANP